MKKKYNGAGIMMISREPDNKEDMEFDPLEAAASDILSAVESADKKKLSAALRAAFQLLDSEPHVEGKHLDEPSEE